MSRGIIYLITNKENGYKYIGQTTQGMNKVWQQHIQSATKMSSEPLHKAFRQYGVHRFGIQELDECDDYLLNERINNWIEKYNPEYNEIKIIPEKKVIQEYKPPLKDNDVNKRNYSHLIPLNEHTRGNGKHCGLKIRGKNLETGICTDYTSARDAATQITGNPINNANILLAARKNGTAYGHKWQILEEKQKKKSVFSVHKKTGEIENHYESIADAVRSLSPGVKSSGLIKSLRNPGRYSWKGYYWYYS
jgi:group I intron endonuclease